MRSMVEGDPRQSERAPSTTRQGRAVPLPVPGRTSPASASRRRRPWSTHVPSGAGWLHEMKYDGYRCLLALAGGKAQDLHPHRARLDRQVPRDRRGRGASSSAARRLARRRDRRPRRQGQYRLLGAPAGDQRRAAAASPCSCSTRSRSTARSSTSCPTIERKQRLAALARRGRAAVHPLCRPYRRQGRAACSRRCARPARKGSSRRRPTRPIAAAAPRTGSRSNARAARNSSSSAGRESDKKGRGFRALLLGVNEGGKLRYAGKVGTGFSTRGPARAARAAGRARGRQAAAPRCPAPRRAAPIG